MAEAVRVRIYDSRIQSFFEPGGDVWGFTRKVVRDADRMASIRAPKRSGELSRSHAHSVTPVGRNHVIGTVRATAPHALWVILGTGPWIYPLNGQYLRVPARRGMYAGGRRGGFVLRERVRGQAGNNYLDAAKRDALRMNGV